MLRQYDIRHIGFLTPGNYPEDQSLAGLEDTLKLFEFGESLGRQRLDQAQTSGARGLFRAGLSCRRDAAHHCHPAGLRGHPDGLREPFPPGRGPRDGRRLSGGRLNVGLSAGPPPHARLLGQLFLDGDPAAVDYSHARVERLAESLRSNRLGDDNTVLSSALGNYRPRIQPIAPGLTERLWYGAGSLRSAEWAGTNRRCDPTGRPHLSPPRSSSAIPDASVLTPE